MMTNFDKIKNTTLGDLFLAINGDEPSMKVLASFMYNWTICERCPCFDCCRAGFVDWISIKINSPSTCKSRILKWLESNTQDALH